MLDLDEAELLEFFGVLPDERTTEEDEFFDTVRYQICREGKRLDISFSASWEDCYLTLYSDAVDRVVFSGYIRGIQSIRMERDKLSVSPRLRIMYKPEDRSDNGPKEYAYLIIDPKIHILLGENPDTFPERIQCMERGEDTPLLSFTVGNAHC